MWGYLSEVIHTGLGEVSLMHSSWQVVQHGSSGPRAERPPQGALKALSGNNDRASLSASLGPAMTGFGFMTDRCPDTDPVVSPVSLPSNHNIQQLDILPENKLFLLSEEKINKNSLLELAVERIL